MELVGQPALINISKTVFMQNAGLALLIALLGKKYCC